MQFKLPLYTLVGTNNAWHVLALLFFSSLIVFQVHASSNTGIEQTVSLPSAEEISVEVFGKSKRLRILWIASTPGIKPRQRQVARGLAQNNFEVWLVDLAESMFLPHSTQTLRSIPPSVVAELINSLSQDDPERVLVVSNSYGAIPALRGIHAWQSQPQKRPGLIGAILFSPNFFADLDGQKLHHNASLKVD